MCIRLFLVFCAPEPLYIVFTQSNNPIVNRVHLFTLLFFRSICRKKCWSVFWMPHILESWSRNGIQPFRITQPCPVDIHCIGKCPRELEKCLHYDKVRDVWWKQWIRLKKGYLLKSCEYLKYLNLDIRVTVRSLSFSYRSNIPVYGGFWRTCEVSTLYLENCENARRTFIFWVINPLFLTSLGVR